MFQKTITSYALLLAAVSVFAIARGQENPSKSGAMSDTSMSEIRNYRDMFRVNKKPIDMVESTRFMCAPPTMVYGPHYDPGVVYYINEIARQSLTTYSNSKLFPVGSIIVKEKQERRTDDTVQIVTVMKKVHAGSSEDSWQYKMYDARNWTEIDRSNHGASAAGRSCIDCHRRYKDNDYVSDRGIELLLGGKQQ